jgi:DNA-binding XRE family transcriptional regulator/DNA-binding CsgD family transcriptional regulator
MAAPTSDGEHQLADAKDPDLVDFGARLRQLRQAAALTQEELAHQAGLHWTYVGQIERGERNLTYKNLLRLAHGLDLAPIALVPDERRAPFEPRPDLSPAQLRIVTLLADGMKRRAVAQQLGMSLSVLQRSLREARKAVGASSTHDLLSRFGGAK